MEKSDHYYLRKEILRNLEVPTISEIKQELGEELGGAILSECPDPLKPVIGLAPPLKGAGDDLWVSPSDILIGKVCLKPPLTTKHIRALTHQGILAIGNDIETKFRRETELEKQRALNEQEEMLRFMCELEKRAAVEAARKEEKRICAKEKEEMRIQFEARLAYELEQLEHRLREEYEQLMKQQKEELETEWQEKLETAVAETVTRLTEKFLEDLAKQEQELLKKFSVEIKKEEIKHKLEIRATHKRCRETFLHLKHQLECKNIANMMYILCVERRKCDSERQSMEATYEKQLQDLQAAAMEKEIEITRLTRERDEKAQQVNLREECLLEILRQFQKFINFALRASPTQAEFLLSIEKMMMFELAQRVAKVDVKHSKYLARKLLPWKTDSEVTSKSSRKSLTPHDHHRCNNEMKPPISEHSLKSNDYLPAFHYDKHMYVREDFRNMMSQGIEISESNLIWNQDVEHLMKILRRSVTSFKEEAEEAMAGDDHNDSSEKYHYEQTQRSSVHFSKHQEQDKDLIFPEFERFSTEIMRSSPFDLPAESLSDACNTAGVEGKQCCSRCTQTHWRSLSTEYENKSPSVEIQEAVPLIGTRDSLEVHSVRSGKPFQQHFALPKLSSYEDESDASNLKPAASIDLHEGAGILCTQDSLHKHRMSLRPVNKIFMERASMQSPEIITLNKRLKQEEGLSSPESGSQDSKEESPLDEHFTMSKLSLARDSFLVHKHSVVAKQQSQSESSQFKISQFLPSTSQDTLRLRKSVKSIPSSNESRTLSKQRLPKKRPRSCSVVVPLREYRSKLSITRDSLELIRSQSKLRFPEGRLQRRSESKDSIEIQNGILGLNTASIYGSQPVIILDTEEDSSKAVKISHIEIVPFEEQPHHAEKPEESKTCYTYDTNAFTAADSPWKVYNIEKIANTTNVTTKVRNKKPLTEEAKLTPSLPRDNFLTKPNVAKVLGDGKATEYLEQNEDFTLHRITSMLTIFRKHPSLIRLFTSCTK